MSEKEKDEKEKPVPNTQRRERSKKKIQKVVRWSHAKQREKRAHMQKQRET